MALKSGIDVGYRDVTTPAVHSLALRKLGRQYGFIPAKTTRTPRQSGRFISRAKRWIDGIHLVVGSTNLAAGQWEVLSYVQSGGSRDLGKETAVKPERNTSVGTKDPEYLGYRRLPPPRSRRLPIPSSPVPSPCAKTSDLVIWRYSRDNSRLHSCLRIRICMFYAVKENHNT
jgi:hypothetical protein